MRFASLRMTKWLIKRNSRCRLLIHQLLFAYMRSPEPFTLSRSFRSAQYLAAVMADNHAAAGHMNAGREELLRHGVRS
jgi:hypothetical protein